MNWYHQHDSECAINHMKSTESMEREEAIKMFLHSLEKRGLKYTTCIGDGDSSSYGMLAQALKVKYSDQYVVVKEHIGHIQKHTKLRKYKTEKKAKKLDEKSKTTFLWQKKTSCMCSTECHTMEPGCSWFRNSTSCMWCEQIWI